MTNSNKTVLALLVTLCLLIVGMFLYKYLKQEEYTYYTPAKSEARYNQYLAVQMLLQKYNLNVESYKQFSSDMLLKNDIKTAVFISTSKIYQQQAVLKQLINWVKKGGYLLLPGPVLNRFNRSEGQFNDLLPDIDIGFVYSKDSGADSDADGNTEEEAFNISGHSYELDIARNVLISTEYPSQWTIGDDKGIYAAAIKQGKGTLVIFNNLNLFSNRQIAINDHAQLFLDLFTRLTNDVDITNIKHIINPESPGLIDVILKYPYVLSLFVVILLMFFWINWGYFGPLYDRFTLTKATIYSHLLFSGQYLWRSVSVEKLYKIVFSEFESSLSRHCHGWYQKSTAEKIKYLEEVTGMPESEVSSFINYQPSKNKKHYYQFCKLSRLIRNKI